MQSSLVIDPIKYWGKEKSTIQTIIEKLNSTKTHQNQCKEWKIKWYHSMSRSLSNNGKWRALWKSLKTFFSSVYRRFLTVNELYTRLIDVESIVIERKINRWMPNNVRNEYQLHTNSLARILACFHLCYDYFQKK